jgi:hypothetical protein
MARTQAQDRAKALEDDVIFWRQTSARVDQTYRAAVARLERKCAKLKAHCSADNLSLAADIEVSVSG